MPMWFFRGTTLCDRLSDVLRLFQDLGGERMKVTLEKHSTNDHWFYLYVDGNLVRVVHLDDLADAPWNNEEASA